MRQSPPPPQLPIFRSRLQAELIGRLYLQPERTFTTGELVDAARESRPTVHRELRSLLGANLVERTRVGRSSLYRAATASPLYAPLRELVEATLGIEVTLARELAALPGVEAAAIFGSWARGEIETESDIDVLVVGDPDRRELARITRAAGARAGREVSASVWTRDELRSAVAGGDVFLTEVMRGALLPLAGDVRAD